MVTNRIWWIRNYTNRIQHSNHATVCFWFVTQRCHQIKKNVSSNCTKDFITWFLYECYWVYFKWRSLTIVFFVEIIRLFLNLIIQYSIPGKFGITYNIYIRIDIFVCHLTIQQYSTVPFYLFLKSRWILTL